MQKKYYFEINPKTSIFSLNLQEIFQYSDLLFLFVRRDFVSVYKQTVLGPLWFFIQPILSSIVFFVVFNKFGKIPTDGIPPFLFYLAGLTAWNYFSTCLITTSNIFVGNAAIFGKVYFPRLILPLSIVMSNLLKFAIQFCLFLFVYGYYMYIGYDLEVNAYILLLPMIIVIMAGLGLGLGLIFSSLTTKYRDLTFLLTFGVQLLMYATPVIYPLAEIPEKYKIYIKLNPMTGIIETFKNIFFFNSKIDWNLLIYSFLFMLSLMFLGVLIFNKTEKNFMDTV